MLFLYHPRGQENGAKNFKQLLKAMRPYAASWNQGTGEGD